MFDFPWPCRRTAATPALAAATETAPPSNRDLRRCEVAFLPRLQKKLATRCPRVAAASHWALHPDMAVTGMACMRPQWLRRTFTLSVSGRDMMSPLISSGRYGIREHAVGRPGCRRLRCKALLRDFIAQRQAIVSGSFLFGSMPMFQAPLTLDLQ